MDILETLTEFGIKNKLAMAYLAPLKMGTANAQQIAKSANIERTTMYSLMEELVDKQLATKVVNGKRLSYVVGSPSRLQELAHKQVGLANLLVPMLAGLQGNDRAVPTVRFYEKRSGVCKVLMESLEAQEKIRRDFASVQRIIDLVGERFINRYVAKRVKLGIRVQSLRCVPEKSQIEKLWYVKGSNLDVMREVHFLAPNIQIEPMISIYDDTVLIIASGRSPFALVIKSPPLADAIKVLFDIVWQSTSQ